MKAASSIRLSTGLMVALLRQFTYAKFLYSTSNTLKPVLDRKMNHILALDFDGVVAASSRESAYSSVLALKSFWPSCDIKDYEIEPIQTAVMDLRPIVETGWENMILARLSLDELRLNGRVDTKKLLMQWNADFRNIVMLRYTSKKEDLLASFGGYSIRIHNLNHLYQSTK
jgi:hypothetical protein